MVWGKRWKGRGRKQKDGGPLSKKTVSFMCCSHKALYWTVMCLHMHVEKKWLVDLPCLIFCGQMQKNTTVLHMYRKRTTLLNPVIWRNVAAASTTRTPAATGWHCTMLMLCLSLNLLFYILRDLDTVCHLIIPTLLITQTHLTISCTCRNIVGIWFLITVILSIMLHMQGLFVWLWSFCPHLTL